MKILVLTNLFPPHHAGSFDFRCENTVHFLAKRGHSVKVLTSHHGLQGEQRDEEIERVLRLNGAYGHPLTATFNEARAIERHNHAALRDALDRFQPDLVYVWSLRGLSKSLMFTLRNSKLPVAYDVADEWIMEDIRLDPWLNWWARPKSPFLSGLARTALELTGTRGRLDATTPTRLARGYERVPEVFGNAGQAPVEPNTISAFRFDRVYFCSQFLKRKTEEAGFRVSHGEVLYPGIATEKFCAEVKPASTPFRKLLVVAQLVPQSGVMTVLKALAAARQNGVKLSLSVYGKGESDYIAPLRSFVVTNQLPVEFLTVSNQVKDLAAVYRTHDGFVQSAEWDDPFPTIPLEAMASGLPVIATRTGGIAEVLITGQNAFIYTPGDHLELASRMQEAQMQPALRQQFAEQGQETVLSKFNEAVAMDQIESFLDRTIESWHAD